MKDKKGTEIPQFVQREANHVQHPSRATELNFGQHLPQRPHE